MNEFFFVIKSLIMTVVLILLMQIKIGKQTVEQHSLNWLHESTATQALRGVADGAVSVGESSYDWLHRAFEKQFDTSRVKRKEITRDVQKRRSPREHVSEDESADGDDLD
jgi:hypothetical protein